MIPSIAEAALTMSQSIELSIVAKATAIVIAGLIAVRMASHARASVRHLLLAATFASLLALPLLLIAAVPGDENALMCASEGGHLAAVQLLVKRGANVNERIFSASSGRRGDGEWRTAVSQAAKNGHKAVVSFLMSNGARE